MQKLDIVDARSVADLGAVLSPQGSYLRSSPLATELRRLYGLHTTRSRWQYVALEIIAAQGEIAARYVSEYQRALGKLDIDEYTERFPQSALRLDILRQCGADTADALHLLRPLDSITGFDLMDAILKLDDAARGLEDYGALDLLGAYPAAVLTTSYLGPLIADLRWTIANFPNN